MTVRKLWEATCEQCNNGFGIHLGYGNDKVEVLWLDKKHKTEVDHSRMPKNYQKICKSCGASFQTAIAQQTRCWAHRAH